MRTIVFRVAIVAHAACSQTEGETLEGGADGAPAGTVDATVASSSDASPLPPSPDGAPPIGDVDAAPVTTAVCPAKSLSIIRRSPRFAQR